jgi:cob(I)alamin adenosyltransferase
MVSSMKIYTKTGDDGETGLFGGPRVRKNAPRIEAYGTVDELNAVIGLVRAQRSSESGAATSDLDELLARIQNELFDLGAQLATPDPERFGIAGATEAHVSALENAIDRYEEELDPLKQFILPGGTPGAAALHLARTVCRRAERWVVTLAETERISPTTVVYLNRLSDLLFVLARAANRRAGMADVPWKKG